LVIGLGNEICGEWGFGWARRLMFMAQSPAAAGNDPPADPLAREYRVSKDAVAAARPRLEDILTSLARRITAQRAAGSPYLVGDTLTAADIWWACFAGYINPLPPDLNPVSASNRGVAAASTPWLDAVKDPVLFQHRDEIYRRHLKLPLEF
jgi:glutathione S-transferase